MAKAGRNAIDLFAVPVEHLPEGVSDTNGNDNYVPKEEVMGEWTAIPTKTEEGLFALRLTYELQTRADQPEQWMQTKNWEIESVEAQGDFVILDMKNKKDHINLLLNYLLHPFSYVYACNNVASDAKHFNLDALFTKFTLSQHWTARKLTALTLNILKFNSVAAEANKKKKSPRKPSASGAGGSRSAPRPVPSGSRVTEGPSRQSTPSKRSREDMKKSGVTEGAEGSSPPLLPTPLKKGEIQTQLKRRKSFETSTTTPRIAGLWDAT